MNTTLIVDATNMAMGTVFSPAVYNEGEVEYELWRYSIFDSVYKAMMENKADEIVLALDSTNPWRKAIYPQYKAHRVKDDAKLDWGKFFTIMNEFFNDIKEKLPFKVVKAERCEADDIIGVLVKHLAKNVVIVSTDGDFKQLISSRVRLYHPQKREFVSCADTEQFIIESCLMGQKKDNIWNVKTPLDWDTEKRKPGLGPVMVEKILAEGHEKWLEKEKLKDRFDLNRRLIDLNMIPKVIHGRVLEQYKEQGLPDPSNILNFFSGYGWRVDKDRIENNLMRNLY